MKNENGITLIELLVASAIVSIFIFIIYSTFSNTSLTIERATPRIEIYQQARVILHRMEKEISSAYFSNSNINIRLKGSSSSNGEYDNDTLYFVSTLNPLKVDTPESDLMEVGYYLRFDSDNKSGILVRRYSGKVDDDIEDGGYEGELGYNIAGLSFQYYNGTDWEDEWDTNKQAKLPVMIEVKIVFYDAQSETEYPVSTVISLPLSEHKI